MAVPPRSRLSRYREAAKRERARFGLIALAVTIVCGALYAWSALQRSSGARNLERLPLTIAPHQALEIRDAKLHLDTWRRLNVSVSGVLRNAGSGSCVLTTVEVKVLDADGRELGRGPAIAVLGEMAPGASAAFKTTPVTLGGGDAAAAHTVRVAATGVAVPVDLRK